MICGKYRLIFAIGIAVLLPLLPGPAFADLVLPGVDAERSSWVVPERSDWTNPGELSGTFAVHGTIGGTAESPLVFGPDSFVSGSGHFENIVSLGVFAPGNSPGVTTGNNQAFGGTVQIDLGGTTPGFGSGRHDQINDSGTIELFNSPTLSLLSFEGFVPSVGDEFVILTWQSGLIGNFGTIQVDPALNPGGNLGFIPVIDNPGGAGSFTISVAAVPEAGIVVVWSMLTCTILSSRRRSAFKHKPSS